MTTPTPRTDAITKLIRDAINEPDRERQIALREGAECGIEQLERDLAAAQERIREADGKAGWLADLVIEKLGGTPDRDAWVRQSAAYYREALDRADAAEARAEANAMDAERYRWLANGEDDEAHAKILSQMSDWETAREWVDEQVDAAIAEGE